MSDEVTDGTEAARDADPDPDLDADPDPDLDADPTARIVERLHDATHDLIRASDPEAVAAELVRAARDVLGYEAAAVWAVRGDERVGLWDPSPDGADGAGADAGPIAADATDTDAAGTVELVPIAAAARDGDGTPTGVDDWSAYGPGSRLFELYRAGEPTAVDDDWFGTETARVVPFGDRGLLGVGGSPDHDADLLSILVADAEVAIESAAQRTALEDERDRLAALFENAGDPIVEVAYDGDVPLVRRVNDAFEETFGYDAAEVVGRDLDELIVPDEELSSARAITDAGRRGESVDRQVTRTTASGPRQFRLRTASFDHDDGRVTGYAIYVDVTEQARYARTLGRLHETARRLMQADDVDEVAQVAAETMSEVLGYPVNGVRLYDADRDALTLVAASERTREVLGERPVYERDGGLVWEVYESGESRVVDDVSTVDDDVDRSGVRSAMYLPLGDHGVLSLGDVSPGGFDDLDRRLGQVLATTVEVALDRARRTSVLRARERELARQNERLEAFATLVSHDLRNPLSVAQGYADLAREAVESGDDATADYFDRVERAHERMEDLIADVLALAREGQRVGETEAVALGETAREAWRTADTARASLTVVDDRDLAADPDRLASLLENLFHNAVEHAGADVAVTVGGTDDGFYVADDGPGIPPDRREQVFERGFSTGEDGTGFGLSIVREIVEAHGWTVSIGESAAGGARIEVRDVDPAAEATA